MNYSIILLWVLIPVGISGSLIIGYDCVAPTTHRAVVSLVDIKPCTNLTTGISSSQIYSQVVQPKINSIVDSYRCLVMYTRSIYRCDWWIENTRMGFKSGVVDLSLSECSRLVRTKTFNYDNIVQHNLVPDTVNQFDVISRGEITGSGSCTAGAELVLDGVTYDKPVVQYSFSISFSREKASVDLRKNTINFKNGMSCNYLDYSCNTAQGSYSWERVYGINSCSPTDMYELLFEGYINKTNDQTGQYYSVVADDFSFTLGVKKKTQLCGHPAYETEYPNILVLEKTKDQDFPLNRAESKLETENIDLMKFIVTKSVQLERKMDVNFKSLQEYLSYSRCTTNIKIINNLLSIAKIEPMEFAYQYTGSQGYTAIKRGEVLYIIKCEPIPVQLIKSSTCYQEIPVLAKDNKTMFLSPKYRILQDVGTEIPCHSFYKPMFKIFDDWIGLEEGIHEAKPPQLLDPNDGLTWNYSLPKNRINGLYSQEELSKFKDYVLSPSRHSSLTNNFINTISQSSNSILISRSFTNQDYKSIEMNTVSSYIDLVLKRLSIFGNIASIAVSVILIWKSIQWVLSILLNGRLLFDIFGWSWKLICSLSDAVSNFILHDYSTKEKRKPQDVESVPLEEPRESKREPTPRKSRIEI